MLVAPSTCFYSMWHIQDMRKHTSGEMDDKYDSTIGPESVGRLDDDDLSEQNPDRAKVGSMREELDIFVNKGFVYQTRP